MKRLPALAGTVVLLAACSPSTPAAVTTPTVVIPPTPEANSATASTSPSAGPTSAVAPSASTVPSPSAARSSTSPLLSAGSLPLDGLSFDSARARISGVSGAVAQSAEFVNHDGTVYCRILGDGRSHGVCELLHHPFIADPGGVCPAGDGGKQIGRIDATATGFVPVCQSDTIAGGAPTATKLGSNQAVTVHGATLYCRDEAFGVTCIDSATQAAFSFGAGGYRITKG